MFGLGFPELLLIFLIIFVLFGVNKLPRLGAGLGEGIRNFQRSLKGTGEGEAKNDTKELEESHQPKTGA